MYKSDIKVKFIRCAQEELESVPVTDGQIIFVTDKNEIYMDNSDSRQKYSQAGDFVTHEEFEEVALLLEGI